MLVELLRLFAPLPRKLSGDAFGLIYEDFLSNFAMVEGRLGGEFFTRSRRFRLGHATRPAVFERRDGGAASPLVVLRRTTHRRPRAGRMQSRR